MRKQALNDDLTPLASVNIIPVIDVSLVLLIILLATAPILDLPGFRVSLPKAITTEGKERNISVSLSTKGELAINAESVTWDHLIDALRRTMKDKEDFVVIVRADQGVAYGEVEKVLELIKRAGAERVAIATEQRQLQ